MTGPWEGGDVDRALRQRRREDPTRWHRGGRQPVDAIGYVYAIRALGTSLAKVGFATDVARRLRTLQIGAPMELRVIWTLRETAVAEDWLHDHLGDRHSRGEWFDFGDEDPVAVLAQFVKDGRVTPPVEADEPAPMHVVKEGDLVEACGRVVEVDTIDGIRSARVQLRIAGGLRVFAWLPTDALTSTCAQESL